MEKIRDIFSDEELEEMLNLLFSVANPSSHWDIDINGMAAQNFLERNKDKMEIWREANDKSSK